MSLLFLQRCNSLWENTTLNCEGDIGDLRKGSIKKVHELNIVVIACAYNG